MKEVLKLEGWSGELVDVAGGTLFLYVDDDYRGSIRIRNEKERKQWEKVIELRASG